MLIRTTNSCKVLLAPNEQRLLPGDETETNTCDIIIPRFIAEVRDGEKRKEKNKKC